jgi:hypothetical protein
MAAGDDLLLTRAKAGRAAACLHPDRPRLAESGHLAEVQVAARAVRVRAASVDRLVREGLPRVPTWMEGVSVDLPAPSQVLVASTGECSA